VKVLFFARLREVNGSDVVEIADSDCPADVAALRELIAARSSEDLAEALRDANVICAVNQRVASDDTHVSPSDEVAFFPPMTGG